MNSLFIYLLELNVALVILFVAYKLFFERDRNFVVRRIYLLGVVILPLLFPLLPDSVQSAGWQYGTRSPSSLKGSRCSDGATDSETASGFL